MFRIAATLAVVLAATTASAESFYVDPKVGNSVFNAVFDAKLGERIAATSSAVDCSATYDESSGTFSGSCAVPLATITVDNEPTKTEHFQQWATNTKTPAKECRFEARFDNVKVGKLVADTPAPFTADVPFTICGRSRSDGGKERVTGQALLFPPGSYGAAKTIRIRAKIENFNRDKYQIGPNYTEGWLARVQALAKVVAEEGTIDLSLFAKTKGQ